MEEKTLNRVGEPDEFSVLRHQNMLSVNLIPREIGDESSVCDATVHVLRKPLERVNVSSFLGRLEGTFTLRRKSRGVNFYQISRRTVQRIAIALGSDKAALQFGFVVGSEKHRCGRTIEVECSLDLQSEVSGLIEQGKKCAETVPGPGRRRPVAVQRKMLGSPASAPGP